MRLLCIANPERYRVATTDVPASYARLAAHPRVTLFHADTAALAESAEELPVVAVPEGFRAEDFPDLPTRPATRASPESFDAVFCRTLKPFPPGYLDALAERAEKVRFVNDPRGIRRQLEPGFLLEAAGPFLPPCLRVDDPGEAEAFFAREGPLVAKRSNSCGGRGVFRVTRARDGSWGTDNALEGERRFGDFEALFAHVAGTPAERILLMRYLPRVVQGDRRVVVVGGEILGAYLRRSGQGHWVQNVAFGAECELVRASAEDAAVVAATAPAYARLGIHVLGYDFLEDDDGRWRVSEINAGNVGGLARLEELGVGDATERLVAFLERHASRREPELASSPTTLAKPWEGPA